VGNFFSFRTMVSNTAIKIVYVLGVIGITLAGGTLAAEARDNGTLIFLGIFVLGQIVWRLLCEAWILFFSMHEQLVHIRAGLNQDTSAPISVSNTAPSCAQCGNPLPKGADFCGICGKPAK